MHIQHLEACRYTYVQENTSDTNMISLSFCKPSNCPTQNWSTITSTWGMFFGTWAIVVYTNNFNGWIDNWKTNTQLLNIETTMAVAALLFNLLKINYDLFFDKSSYKTRMIVSVILTFLTFVFYTVFYGMAAQSKGIGGVSSWIFLV